MFEKSKRIVSICVFLLLTISSLAQHVPEKYIVFVFESTRWYSGGYMKHPGHFKDNYYWIAKSDSLFSLASDTIEYPVLYPLYFGSIKTVVNSSGKTLIQDLYPDNTDRDLRSKISKKYALFPLLKVINDNKIKIQTIRTKYKPRRQCPERRRKERVIVYCVPIWGCFEKALDQVEREKYITVYHPLTMEDIKVAELDKDEMMLLYKLECNSIDFSSIRFNYDFWHKGWCSLKVAPQ